MNALLRLAQGITAGNRGIARAVAWLTLLMVLGYFLIVVLRYGFGIGSIALQEFVIYLHAAVFIGAAAYTLADDGHVRVDILYTRFSARRQAGVDCIGSLLFTLPFAAFLLWAAWDYVGESWRLREASGVPGGLPYVYLLKTLIPILAIQLMAQALASAVLAFDRWRGSQP